MRIDMIFSEGADPMLMVLYVDHKMCPINEGRLRSYVYGKPLSKWLYSYVKGMHQWSGWLQELATTVNSSTYDLWISASGEVLEAIRTAAEQSGCAVGVFQVKQTVAQSEPVAAVLNELDALARTRLVHRYLHRIRNMAQNYPCRIIYDAGGNITLFQMKLSDWKFDTGEYTLPLAFVSSYREIDEVRRLIDLSGLREDRIAICVVNGEAEKGEAIHRGCRDTFKEALIFRLDKLENENPVSRKEFLKDVVKANVRFALKQLYMETEEKDWKDAEKAKELLLSCIKRKGEVERGEERCVV